MSTKFEIRFEAGKVEKIECDGYKIKEGFITFVTKGFNVLSLKSKYIDSVAFCGEKHSIEELDELREKFRKEYESKV